MGKYKSLAKNGAYVFIGNAGSKAISFLMLPFYTRWLSVEQFGIADLVVVYVSMLYPFVSWNLGQSIFIFPSNCDKKQQTIYFSSCIYFSFLMFFLLSLVFCFFKTAKVINNTIFVNYVWYIFVLIFASIILDYLQQFCMALGKMKIFSVSGVLLSLGTAVFGFLLVPKYKIQGYLWSLTIANACSFIFIFFAISAYKYLSIYAIRKSDLTQMLKYSIPLIPDTILWWLVTSFNRIVLERYAGIYFIGLYAIASKPSNVVKTIFNSMTNAWYVSVIKEYGRHNFEAFFNNILRLSFTVICLFVMLVGLMSELIIKLMADSSYYEAWIYSPLLVLPVIFLSLNSCIGGIFRAVKTSKYFLYSTVAGAIVSAACTLYTVPLWGIWGAIISLLLSHFIIFALMIWFSKSYIRILNKKYYCLFLLVSILFNSLFPIVNNYFLFVFIYVLVVLLCLFLNKDYLNRYRSILVK